MTGVRKEVLEGCRGLHDVLTRKYIHQGVKKGKANRVLQSKCGRTQPLLTGFHISGGSTEGSLGGWLAQRQAALRGKLAAGARFDFTLVSRACRLSLEHLVCQRKAFLESEPDWA